MEFCPAGFVITRDALESCSHSRMAVLITSITLFENVRNIEGNGRGYALLASFLDVILMGYIAVETDAMSAHVLSIYRAYEIFYFFPVTAQKEGYGLAKVI
jgi:hypothetical protein